MSLPNKINNIVNHFWDSCKRKYLANLRGYQKLKYPNKHQHIVNVQDIVIVQENKMPQPTTCLESWNRRKIYQGNGLDS